MSLSTSLTERGVGWPAGYPRSFFIETLKAFFSKAAEIRSCVIDVETIMSLKTTIGDRQDRTNCPLRTDKLRTLSLLSKYIHLEYNIQSLFSLYHRADARSPLTIFWFKMAAGPIVIRDETGSMARRATFRRYRHSPSPRLLAL